MKVFVTGANGFVGKVLIRRLEEYGLNTWAVVRKKTVRVKEVTLDLRTCNEDELFEKLGDADCIVHLAANADFRSSFSKEIYEVNCLANIAMTNICKRLGLHLVFASNALIAGMHEEQINEQSQDNPSLPYNVSKYISERYISNHVKDYCIMRIGGIYGYGGPSHLFLNRAIDLAKDERKLFNIQNNGLGERNYIYVEDLCSWIIHIIQNRIIGKHWVAGGETLALKKIFDLLNEVFIDGQASFFLDDSVKGASQIINVKLPPIKMHSYQMAFVDIKNKASFS